MHYIRSEKGRWVISLLVMVFITTICLSGVWLYEQPKFQDVTIELGSEYPELDQFLTKYAVKDWVVAPEAVPDITSVGSWELTFQHDVHYETVTLHVVDTTAPKVTFRDVTTPIDQLPAPEDFVAEISDLSPTTVSFAQPLTPPESYGLHTVQILVSDSSGNVTAGECGVLYVWMRERATLELGDTLEKADLLLNPEQDADLLDQAQLDAITGSPLGQYTVTSTADGQSCQCIVTVQDTTPPELVLQWVTTYKDKPVEASAFVKSVSDLSGEVTTRFAEPLPDFSQPGIFVVTIDAVDSSGNVRTEKATLEVIVDNVPPVIYGLFDLTVAKNSSPDFLDGVSAKDEKDGTVDFTCDSSKVNTAVAGTYYVTYTASDKSGNVTTYRRKVTVLHDAADTAALVSEIAAKLSSDPEAIRDYVRSSIGYSTNWGGEDPIWYGFKNKTGNCYVHAMCLQALLREKGYTTQLIWVTNKSHYWNLINLGGAWKHIDATPSTLHSRYSLMSDAQRMETLSGRDWDHSAWPACS